MVRGLDYYTRTAFEWISGVLAANKAGTVNAGGRYDGLAETLGGPPTPGVGFAMGLDRVLLALEGEGRRAPARAPRLFVVALGEEAREARTRLVERLRTEGVAAAHAFEERPQGAAQDGGSCRRGVRGHRRGAGARRRHVTLRRLVDGVQKSVPRDDVADWLAKLDDRMDGST